MTRANVAGDWKQAEAEGWVFGETQSSRDIIEAVTVDVYAVDKWLASRSGRNLAGDVRRSGMVLRSAN